MPHQLASSFQKLYVQLRPSPESLQHLLELQSALSVEKPGRLVPERQLHMTIIHFGKIGETFDRLHDQLPCTPSQYAAAINELVSDWEALRTDETFVVQPIGLDGFGPHGRSLAIRYQPTPALTSLHAASLTGLIRFFERCGITDVDRFMVSDDNFQFARGLTPHITLIKGFEGILPDLPLESLTLWLMPFMYD